MPTLPKAITLTQATYKSKGGSKDGPGTQELKVNENPVSSPLF